MTDKAPTFAEQVQSTAEQFIKDDKGKLALPEGVEVSEEVLYAATIEKRRKDTQSSFTKLKNENIELSTENKALAKQWEKDVSNNLTTDDQAELAELKASDPDAWLAKLEEHKTAATSKFEEKKTELQNHVKNETEKERRTRLVTEYNANNPEYVINDDVINNDLPPRLVTQFTKGELTFDEFLEKSSKFLQTPKVIEPGVSKPEEPNLATSGGRSTPSNDAIEADIHESYKTTTF
jgi:hypothetical protein